MAQSNNLYHLTHADCVGDIFLYGLCPKIGENSSLSGETKPAIYLCSADDIKTWQILTGADICMEIDASVIRPEGMEEINYGKYSEVRVYDDISKKAVIGCRTLRGIDENGPVMTTLAESYLQTMSLLCESICETEYHLKNPDITDEYREELVDRCERIKDDVLACARIMKRINFDTLTDGRAARVIRFHSNEMCGISLADTYLNPIFYDADMFPDAGVRCWEHLNNIDGTTAPMLVMPGHVLYRCIRKYVPYYAKKLKHIGGFAPPIFKTRTA